MIDSSSIRLHCISYGNVIDTVKAFKPDLYSLLLAIMSSPAIPLQPDWEVISRMLWASSPEWTFGVGVVAPRKDARTDSWCFLAVSRLSGEFGRLTMLSC